ncbi:F-box protein: endocytic membrane traffic, recycling ReCYcling 1 [Yamadazyma tenuis]|uniref:F-box domain-containing protein n=1 Tax=Candida tenuis (strain ATCC 10573 / BCRC 21748 / CBS 615 / JCM 9827 / NBRC 10315 / NRRL Y-1498 / VKM Y-70) TaxID=590646 RepID=G3B5T3_CANTC|nr:uncharacterized protein CANTEDRAFT_94063 [Yamadazyma tenuis ATCC 10573]EGV63295.1 hypothetical protein CANTEDRAFT_94063 [Yamadazyma tenuis ATCC 10573]WEJ96883.1 F-box protein: endocytic membrane traffic, recycling ReCYcling 1 [Yamadazyma tenuis]
MAQVIWNSDIDVYNPDVIAIPVAQGIVKYLAIADLLVFSRVSKNAYKTVNDPQIWISMLKEIGLWRKEGTNETKDINSLKLNALNCMDQACSTPARAKKIVLGIHKSLEKFYVDLLSNKSYDKLKIFQEFQSPEEQCKILNNLMQYSHLDKNDETRFTIQEKLGSLFEIFENALLRELDIHFDLEDYSTMKRFVNVIIELNNHQTLIDFFMQKSIFDNHDNVFGLLEYFNPEEFFTNKTVGEELEYELNSSRFNELMNQLITMFNYESRTIDLIFPKTVPMMYKVSEELILNQLADIFNRLIEASKGKKLYLSIVPYLYDKIVNSFISKLNQSENLGGNYLNLIQELFDMSFEQVVTEYSREEIVSFKGLSNQKIQEWKESIERREVETSQNILRNVKTETKNDFLTSFRKAFAVGSNRNTEDEQVENESYSEIQAKEKILTENMKSINKIFSLKLAMQILNDGKNCLIRMLHFKDFTIVSVRQSLMTSVQEIFISVLESIGNDHLKPGFDKALVYLRTYKPVEDDTHAPEPIKPLVLFSDLVNVADLIMQMVEIFYKEELINRRIIKNENSILNPSLQRKKKLEEMVDNYVADGLNIGIDVLIDEIEQAYSPVLQNNSYCPHNETSVEVQDSTPAARRVVSVLDGNFDLLVGCADKSVIDVFQQELAERFFQVIVKVMKSATISNTGAVTLISDLNIYYECILNHIKTNKRFILPLFESLKKVGSIYLIGGNDSKAIGKLVSDLSKFNGIFGQEEIYEFVQRREDWPLIKKDVEKIMYGLSLGDCVIA